MPNKYYKGNYLQGFTLIGLVLSIIIISICAIPLSLMFGQASRAGLPNRITTIATALAEEKMDEVLRLGYSGVSDQGLTDFPVPFDDYSYQVVVHYVDSSDLNTPVEPTITDYRTVEVNLRHDDIATITIKSLLTAY